MSISRTLKQFLTGTIASLSFAYSAQAGLISVKSIEISNALNTWLQVAEVVALDSSSNDVALTSAGAIATAPDAWSSISTAINAIDGITAGNYGLGQIFHEGSDGSGDTLTITFASTVELISIQIFGRTDCCTSRDLYNVSFFDDNGSSLYSSEIDSRNATSSAFVLPNTALNDSSNLVPAPNAISLFGLALLSAALIRRKTFKF